MTRFLTWRNLGRHLLAFFVACISVGIVIIAISAAMEIFEKDESFGKPGLLGFIFGMGSFMGVYYIFFAGPYVFAGIVAGLWVNLRQCWFSASWGALSTLAASHFHLHNKNLDAPSYLVVALAGFLAGIIYWLIAVRKPKASLSQPPPTIPSH